MFDKVLGVRGGGPVFVIVFRCVGVGVGEVGGGVFFYFQHFVGEVSTTSLVMYR